MKKVIIIPVHNQLSYLQKCIESITAHTKDPYELIIVNDGSDKETSEWIYTQLKNCTVLSNEKPKGFSNACNLGIEHAVKRFDFNCLCLLNSDTEIITENWFDIVEEEFIKRCNVGCASVVSNNATHQTIFNPEKYIINLKEKPTIETTLIHGFCFFISKKLINKIGMFDEKLFPHYGSEDDYVLRAIQNGFKNILVCSVFINHNGATSYTKDKREQYMGNSIPNLLNKWGKTYINKCCMDSNDIQKRINT
jgi:O-antigen biosynthesis protein